MLIKLSTQGVEQSLLILPALQVCFTACYTTAQDLWTITNKNINPAVLYYAPLELFHRKCILPYTTLCSLLDVTLKDFLDCTRVNESMTLQQGNSTHLVIVQIGTKKVSCIEALPYTITTWISVRFHADQNCCCAALHSRVSGRVVC